MQRLKEQEGYDASEMVVLTPTRGMTEHYPNVGCAQVANFFTVRKVRSSRFYDESSNGQDQGPLQTYDPEKGKINVMTTCASKGLDWQVVFLLTPHDSWFNCVPTSVDARHHGHQVYVGTSRAKTRLVILATMGHLHRCFDVPSMRDIRPDLDQVLAEYRSHSDPEPRGTERYTVTQLASSASPESLAFFQDHIFEIRDPVLERRRDTCVERKPRQCSVGHVVWNGCLSRRYHISRTCLLPWSFSVSKLCKSQIIVVPTHVLQPLRAILDTKCNNAAEFLARGSVFGRRFEARRNLPP